MNSRHFYLFIFWVPLFGGTLSSLSCTTTQTTVQKSQDQALPAQQIQLGHQSQRIKVENLPIIEESAADTPIQLAAFSSLVLEELTPEKWLLTAVTDRGPNTNSNHQRRSFAIPQFSPSLIQLNYNPQTKRARFLKRLPLTLPKGQRVTGLPNNVAEEMPIDLQNRPLPPDPNGLDIEGLVKAQDGSYWVSEEYGPSLVHFSKSGEWLARYVPQGHVVPGMIKTKDILPKKLAHRRPNRGFEAVAREGNLLYAFMQSPLTKKSQTIYIIEFDMEQEKVTGEYAYIMTDPQVEKIGDAQSLGNGQFLIIELDDLIGSKSKKYLKLLDLKNATNLLKEPVGQVSSATSRTVINLTAVGFDYAQKAEGLELAKDRSTVLIVNDNDFNLSGELDPVGKTLGLKNEPTEIFIFKLSQPLTTADRSWREVQHE